MSELLKGTLVQSSDNVTYTDNTKDILELFTKVDGFIDNLKNDSDSVGRFIKTIQI